MKTKKTPLLLLAALAAVPPLAIDANAQILRDQGSDQPAAGTPSAGTPNPGAPNTGIRRVPVDHGAPTESAAPPASGASAAPTGATPPAALGAGPAAEPPTALPAAPGNDLAQAAAAARPLSAAEASAFAAALKAIDESRWTDARAAVANFRHALLDRYITWSILRAAPKTEADFAATWRFLRESPDWPEPEVLRRQAEDRIGPSTPNADVFRYFTAFPPLTSAGHLRRLDAAQAVNPNEVAKFARDTWQNATLRTSDENDFLNRFGHLLTGADHVARFDRIMSTGRTEVARDLLSKLPPDYQPIASARLAMATRSADAANLLKAVPASKLNEPALRLERAQWLRRTGNLDEARKAFAATGSTPPAGLPDAWWNERNQLARDLLAAGKPADAYAVASTHSLTKGVAFAEAEFLAGWTALRQLKKPAEALKHFQKLHDGVSTDLSKSRGAYWIGRSQEALGRAKEANDWYGRAAVFGQTFYGQLAARKLPGGAAKLPSDPVASAEERQVLDGRELTTMARYLGQAGDYERARPFLLRLARLVTSPGETALLADLALDLKRPDVGLTIARRAPQNGITLFDAAFPVVDLGATGSVERALALALTRQESSFNAAAVSSSGALGLMQLLPGTARDVAGRLNVPFIQEKLTRDPAYNVQLGSQYIAEMLQRFGGSYEVALAAYNAGPNRVARWLESVGDPRTGKIDMVDWIETLPFRETRDYVQRIMEGLTVYRDRLNGQARTVPPALGRS